MDQVGPLSPYAFHQKVDSRTIHLKKQNDPYNEIIFLKLIYKLLKLIIDLSNIY